jgi:LAO/AO transport system kinase
LTEDSLSGSAGQKPGGRAEALTPRELARLATQVENGAPEALEYLTSAPEGAGLIVGVTGPPGAGKSSLVDALTTEIRRRGLTVAIVAVDPSSRASGGAILGDRVRMQRHHADDGVFIRSTATRGATGGLARTSAALSRLFRSAGFDFVIIETVGVGQDEVDVAALADVTVVVLVPGMGDDIQALKAGVMEIADIFVINKADRTGAEQTRREIEGMLSLGQAGIAPAIFQTVAIEGTGVTELLADLESRQRKMRDHRQQWEIDHLGIAVRSIDEALPFYASHLGLPVLSRETVEYEKVKVAMVPAGTSRIELLEALDASSTIAKFIEKRGPGLHHVAMRVPDLHSTIRRLESAGVRLLGTPRRGAGGHLYVFVHPASAGGVLWELIQD